MRVKVPHCRGKMTELCCNAEERVQHQYLQSTCLRRLTVFCRGLFGSLFTFSIFSRRIEFTGSCGSFVVATMLVSVGLKWSLRSFEGLMGTSCWYRLIMTVLSY